MDWVTALATYFLIWWITLYLVLPLGDRSLVKLPEKGHDAGAPENPRSKQKLVLTSMIAAVVWAVVYTLIYCFDLNFRDIVA